MKEKFEYPKIETVLFDKDDIIITSPGDGKLGDEYEDIIWGS